MMNFLYILSTLISIYGVQAKKPEIRYTLPEKARKGAEVFVKVSVIPNGNSGIMKYEQELPFGFFVTKMENNFGDDVNFEVEEKLLKVYWTQVDSGTKEISFDMTLTTPDRKFEAAPFTGKLFYFDEKNNQKEIKSKTQTIKIY
jgi:hypothetical protein